MVVQEHEMKIKTYLGEKILDRIMKSGKKESSETGKHAKSHGACILRREQGKMLCCTTGS